MASPPSWLTTVDAEDYSLSSPPARSSGQVRAARRQLLADLDLPALSDDLSRVSRLLALSHGAACAARHPALAAHVAALSRKVAALVSATAAAVAHSRLAARAVLAELPAATALLRARAAPAALHALAANDALARTLARLAAALAADLSSAADDAAAALAAAHAARAARAACRDALADRVTELAVRRAAAWETHGAMLESLSEAARLYDRAARAERYAARRAAVFAPLRFVERLDAFLTDTFGVAALAPLVRFLEAVRKDAAHAREERAALLDAKRRQRALNREALRDVQECTGRIREVKSEVDAVMAAIESLHAVAQELKRLAVVVMRVAAFWGQLQANMGRLSSAELVRLIRATADPALGVSGTGELPLGVEAGAEGGGDGGAEGNTAGEGRTGSGDGESGEDGVIDVSEGQEEWVPCTAVRRKMVIYYARWVALGDVCNECLQELEEAKAEAAKAIKLQAEVCELTPVDARQEVTRMAADLRKEMEAINEELDQFREHLDEMEAGAGSTAS